MFLLAGCGGGDERSTAPPKLPRPLALGLADTSHAVAVSLSEGDACRALTLVRSLRRQALAAANTGRVPTALQQPLRTAVDRLAGRIHCSPPAATTPEQSVPSLPEEHGKGKHKGHEKHKKAKHGKGND